MIRVASGRLSRQREIGSAFIEIVSKGIDPLETPCRPSRSPASISASVSQLSGDCGEAQLTRQHRHRLPARTQQPHVLLPLLRRIRRSRPRRPDSFPQLTPPSIKASTKPGQDQLDHQPVL
jgi:hypothetical protein